MTKPNFILNRAKSIFTINEPKLQKEIYNTYIKNRNKDLDKSCYCGHTIDCECSNPSIEEFKHNLLNNNIYEDDLI